MRRLMNQQRYRQNKLRDLTDSIGIYALCDLEGVPIYVGQSVDGIRTRVRRHLTSARSDIIANRQIDVWEVAYVRAWPVEDRISIPFLESAIFGQCDAVSPLMNGRALDVSANDDFPIPDCQIIQVIEEQERMIRLRPDRRLPRQISQYLTLVDYILTVKDAAHLRKALNAHFERLVKYHRQFLD